jgi:hypothetical protein
VDGWIKKMWYIYIMEFYSAIKKNEIMLFAGKWMELEIVMLSEIIQSHKINISYFLLFVEAWGKTKTKTSSQK